MVAAIEVQHALHGYSDGHRLVASSSRLSKASEREMLLFSDISGPGGGDQFEPYLTGYPVEAEGLYAIGRTWPAPEMGRPGCVWTHTLLVRKDDLVHLRDPFVLLPFFVRPSLEVGFEDFLKPSIVSLVRPENGDSMFHDSKWDAALIRSLYSRERPYTVLAVEQYSLAEGPFLGIWRLQWPSLQFRFTFCTGVRSLRRYRRECFYLQAAIPRDIRRFNRGETDFSVIEHASSEVDQEHADWIVAACTALKGEDSGLLDFLKNVGFMLPGDCSLFRPVIDSYRLLKKGPEETVVHRLVRLASEVFPRPDAGREFKVAFFVDGLGSLSELQLIRGLTSTSEHWCLDVDEMRMRDRGHAAWSLGVVAWQLLAELLSGELNDLGEDAISGLCAGMPEQYLESAAEEPQKVLAGIIKRAPQLARSKYIWKNPTNASAVAQTLLDCQVLIADQCSDIVREALAAQVDPQNPTLIQVFGGCAIAAILDWHCEDYSREVPKGWQSAMSEYTDSVVEWIMSNPSATLRTRSLCFLVLRPEDVAFDARFIAVLSQFFAETGRDSESVLVAVKFLRESFLNSSLLSAEIASIVFDVVYDAAATSKISIDAWEDLLPVLTASSWWQDWDRCKQLRRSVAESFRTGRWPAAQLVKVTNDDHVFEQLVEDLRERRSGRKILELASAAIDEDSDRKRLLRE